MVLDYENKLCIIMLDVKDPDPSAEMALQLVQKPVYIQKILY